MTDVTHVVGPKSPMAAFCGAILLALGIADRPETEALLWADVAGRPLLAWSIAAFAATTQISEIVLLIAPQRETAARELIETAGWERVSSVSATAGGARQVTCQRDAVLMALEQLAPGNALVCIHQCARPLVTPALIARGISIAEEQDGVGAIASEPVKETLKQVQRGVVVTTPPRANLALLQTPQVFPKAALIQAYQDYDANCDVVDAAQVALAFGMLLVTFPGGYNNLLVSQHEDLALVEAHLLQRQNQAKT